MLLRFYDAAIDGERLCSLCRLLLDGMSQREPSRMFCAAALQKPLALCWISTLGRLHLTCAKHLSHRAQVLSFAQTQPATAHAIATSRQHLTSSCGPVLRLLLCMCDPFTWLLTKQLSDNSAGASAAAALTLMGMSALQSAAEQLLASIGVFVQSLFEQLDTSMLAAAVSIASAPLQPLQPEATAGTVRAFVFGVLAVPLPTAGGGASGDAILTRIRQGGAVYSRVSLEGPSLAREAKRLLRLHPNPADSALIAVSNLLALRPTAPPPLPERLGALRLLQSLMDVAGEFCAAAGSNSKSTFHPLLGWSTRAPSPELRLRSDDIRTMLQLLWSPPVLQEQFQQVFSPLGTRPAWAPLASLRGQELRSLTEAAAAAATLQVTALRVLAPPLRTHGMARLAYGSHLVPSIWALLSRLTPAAGKRSEAWLVELVSAAGAPIAQLAQLLVDGAAHLLPVLDDREIFDEEHPLAPSELASLGSFVNKLAYRLLYVLVPSSLSSAQQQLSTSAVRLLSLLVERDARRPFCAVGAWLIRSLDVPKLRREFFVERSPRALALVGQTPWVVPFEQRVQIFRELVAHEKASLRGETLPEHLRGHHVKIRREHMLEDGYVQLGGLLPEQLKGTIRVEFVSELGMAEAGIDRFGVFKEFLEETATRAFDENLGLFKGTQKRQLYPSPTSELAVGPSHLQLFEFVGRMLGKAVYEGIVLDVSIADFFAAKLLGKHNSLDELPSLDAALFNSLAFLKQYHGDVEADLCLTFSVDLEDFGKRETVELREGGSAIPVTKDNRIEYVHLMADYRLNKQLAPQSKAFVRGFHSVVPAGWLRLFSTPELQTLINGDDAPIDVADLRKHTRYAGGYHELSPTIRDLWSVLNDFSREDRALFLKFVTSCSKAPLLGFEHLQPPFTIQCVGADGSDVPSVLAFFGMGRNETTRLPTASTCFNLLKLPNFKSKRVLREKLLYAVRSASGFELS